MSSGRIRLGLPAAVALALVLVSAGTFGAYSAQLLGNGTLATGSLVLSAGSCNSSATTITTDSTNCTGTLLPLGELYNANAINNTTLASSGTLAPTALQLTQGTTGTQVVADVSGNGDTGWPYFGVTLGTSGPLSSTAASFDGSTGYIMTQTEFYGPSPVSIAAWFRVSSGYSSGGPVIAFRSSQGTGYTSHDRQIWMDNSGHIEAGIWNTACNCNQQIGSPGAYNDGGWHYLVFTIGASGEVLYVDGTSVASNASYTTPETTAGWWTLGYFDNTSWTDLPASAYWKGSLAQVAVFPLQLSSAQASGLYTSTTTAMLQGRASSYGLTAYWPLTDDGSGDSASMPLFSSLPDLSGNGNLGTLPNGDVSPAAGPLSGGGGAYLDGNSSWIQTKTQYSNPQNFTLAAWFRTPSFGYARGEPLIGFASTQSTVGCCDSYDRNLWLDNSGHVVAGIYQSSAVREITSTGVYNDGNWHLAAVTVSSTAGMTLYVDGASVTSNAGYTSPQSYSGYWHVGYAGLGGSWADAPSNTYVTGFMADAAVFGSVLTGAQISSLYGQAGASAYTSAVQALGPKAFWPLSDSGTSVLYNDPFYVNVTDASGNLNAATPAGGGGVTFGEPGPLSANATYLNGSSSYLETTTQYSNPQTFSLAAWVRVPSGFSSGEPIIGFGSSQGTGSSSHDRKLWMDNSGHLVGGVYQSSTCDEITSTGTYNDGNWHFVVFTVGSGGSTLYVDGTKVASNAAYTSPQSYAGYWHVGYFNTSGWPNAPSNSYFTGSLADAAYLPSTLTSAQVGTLYSQATAAAFKTQMLALSPAAYWPLTDSGTIAGGVEMTISVAQGASSKCLFPTGASCPATGPVIPAPQTWTGLYPPTSTSSDNLAVFGTDLGTPPATMKGLHIVVPLTLVATRATWTATIAYLTETVEL